MKHKVFVYILFPLNFHMIKSHHTKYNYRSVFPSSVGQQTAAQMEQYCHQSRLISFHGEAQGSLLLLEKEVRGPSAKMENNQQSNTC